MQASNVKQRRGGWRALEGRPKTHLCTRSPSATDIIAKHCMIRRRRSHQWSRQGAADAAAKTKSSASLTSLSHAVVCFVNVIAVDRTSKSHRMLCCPRRRPTSERDRASKREPADDAAKTSSSTPPLSFSSITRGRVDQRPRQHRRRLVVCRRRRHVLPLLFVVMQCRQRRRRCSCRSQSSKREPTMPPRHRHSLRRHPCRPSSSALPSSSSTPPCPRPRRRSMDSRHCQTRAAVAAFVIVADDRTSESHRQRAPLPSSSWSTIERERSNKREPPSTRAAAIAAVAVTPRERARANIHARRRCFRHHRLASDREPSPSCE